MLGKLAILVAVAVAAASAAVPTILTAAQKSGVSIDDLWHFWNRDTERTHEEALKYCYEQGAGMVRVNLRLYSILRTQLKDIGEYWIDGKIDFNPSGPFSVDERCTTTGNPVDLTDIANIDITGTTCLTLNKGTNVASSKISSKGCDEKVMGVICVLPKDWQCSAPP